MDFTANTAWPGGNLTWKDRGDKEKDLQRKMNVLDEEKDGIWREMYVENKSSRSWSPPAISPLTGIVVAEDTHVDGRKNGKG